MAKRNKQKSEQQQGSTAEEKRTNCVICDKSLSKGQTEVCSDACEIVLLKGELAKKDEKLERVASKDKPAKCYGRIVWAACVQEWYKRRTFDAKRRAVFLKKQGYECSAKTIGEVPIVTESGIVEQVGMTLLTCRFKEANGQMFVPPEPAEFAGGLAKQDEKEAGKAAA